SLTGYLPAAAIGLDSSAVRALIEATRESPDLSFGFVESAKTGELPYITQVVARRGELIAVHRKASLGEGEDADFQPGTASARFRVAGVSCALAVCAEIGVGAPYETRARIILGPSAPGLYGDRNVTDDDWRRGFDWWHGSVLDDARRLV